MKVLTRQFLSTNHSWASVGQNLSRSLIKKGHEVHLFSTNGTKHFPNDLKSNLIGYIDESRQVCGKLPDNEYDCQISYTAMKNFPQYLSHGSKNRFGIWCYEFIADKNPLPDGFAKYYKYTDKVLPPSNFAKQVFLNSGVPESHMRVVPHGIDFNQIDASIPYRLKTKKSTKIAIILGQIHRRKALDVMLEMFGKAFTKKDDVCLVLKVEDREPTHSFELSFNKIFSLFKNKFPNHAEIEIIREFIPNIFSLYKCCDIILYTSHCEGFGLPSLEGLALGKINLASRYGGVLDFLNDENSLLVDGKSFTVTSNFLYWSSKVGLKAFMPDIDDGVSKLKFAVENKEMLLEKYQKNIALVRENYSWDVITNQILELVENV